MKNATDIFDQIVDFCSSDNMVFNRKSDNGIQYRYTVSSYFKYYDADATAVVLGINESNANTEIEILIVVSPIRIYNNTLSKLGIDRCGEIPEDKKNDIIEIISREIGYHINSAFKESIKMEG